MISSERWRPCSDGLLLQDLQTGLMVRVLQGRDEPGVEPGVELLVEIGDVLGENRTGEDDLLVVVGQGVQRVPKFDLGLFLPAEEMHLLQQQGVAGAAIFVFEFLDGVVLQREDHLVHELFGRNIVNPEVGFFLEHGISDRLGEVALAQAGLGQDEERVVGGTAPFQRKGFGGGVGKFIALAHDETVEGEIVVQGPPPPGAPNRDVGKHQLHVIPEGGRGRTLRRCDDLELKAVPLCGDLPEAFLHDPGVVLQNPVHEEPVGTPQKEVSPVLFDERDGLDPDRVAFRRQLQTESFFQGFPGSVHGRLSFRVIHRFSLGGMCRFICTCFYLKGWNPVKADMSAGAT